MVQAIPVSQMEDVKFPDYKNDKMPDWSDNGDVVLLSKETMQGLKDGMTSCLLGSDMLAISAYDHTERQNCKQAWRRTSRQIYEYTNTHEHTHARMCMQTNKHVEDLLCYS